MQFDPLRAFPYPVLRPGVDDYIDGEIQATIEFSPEGQDVSASVQVVVSAPEIINLIKGGSASYAVVFACRDTYFRHVELSQEPKFNVKFPSGSLRGEVQVYPYVTATRQITGFCSTLINPEFGPGPFQFDEGAALAIDEPQTVYIDRDVFRPLKSIFEIEKSDTLTGYEWQVKSTDDKIHIVVSEELKHKIDVARNTAKNKAVLMNSIYFSAVMQCLVYLKQSPDDYGTQRWANVMKQKCHNEGIDLAAHDEYLIAERLMKTYVFEKGGVE
jgi:hypothetical protein